MLNSDKITSVQVDRQCLLFIDTGLLQDESGASGGDIIIKQDVAAGRLNLMSFLAWFWRLFEHSPRHGSLTPITDHNTNLMADDERALAFEETYLRFHAGPLIPDIKSSGNVQL